MVHNHGDALILNCSSVHPAHERTTWDNDAATEEYGAVTNIYKVLNKLQLFLQLRENSQPQFILLKISVSHWVHVRNFIYIYITFYLRFRRIASTVTLNVDFEKIHMSRMWK